MLLDQKAKAGSAFLVAQHNDRRPLIVLTEHGDNGRARTFVFDADNINFVTQPWKICEQPFQGYAFRSIKRTIKPFHEITLKQKQCIFNHRFSLHSHSVLKH